MQTKHIIYQRKSHIRRAINVNKRENHKCWWICYLCRPSYIKRVAKETGISAPFWLKDLTMLCCKICASTSHKSTKWKIVSTSGKNRLIVLPATMTSLPASKFLSIAQNFTLECCSYVYVTHVSLNRRSVTPLVYLRELFR